MTYDDLIRARQIAVEIAHAVRSSLARLPDGDDPRWRAPAQRAYLHRLDETRSRFAMVAADAETACAALDAALGAALARASP